MQKIITNLYLKIFRNNLSCSKCVFYEHPTFENIFPFCNFYKKKCYKQVNFSHKCFKYNYHTWLRYDIKWGLWSLKIKIKNNFKNKEIQELRMRIINLEKNLKRLSK